MHIIIRITEVHKSTEEKQFENYEEEETDITETE